MAYTDIRLAAVSAAVRELVVPSLLNRIGVRDFPVETDGGAYITPAGDELVFFVRIGGDFFVSERMKRGDALALHNKGALMRGVYEKLRQRTEAAIWSARAYFYSNLWC